MGSTAHLIDISPKEFLGGKHSGAKRVTSTLWESARRESRALQQETRACLTTQSTARPEQGKAQPKVIHRTAPRREKTGAYPRTALSSGMAGDLRLFLLVTGYRFRATGSPAGGGLSGRSLNPPQLERRRMAQAGFAHQTDKANTPQNFVEIIKTIFIDIMNI